MSAEARNHMPETTANRIQRIFRPSWRFGPTGKRRICRHLSQITTEGQHEGDQEGSDVEAASTGQSDDDNADDGLDEVTAQESLWCQEEDLDSDDDHGTIDPDDSNSLAGGTLLEHSQLTQYAMKDLSEEEVSLRISKLLTPEQIERYRLTSDDVHRCLQSISDEIQPVLPFGTNAKQR